MLFSGAQGQELVKSGKTKENKYDLVEILKAILFKNLFQIIPDQERIVFNPNLHLTFLSIAKSYDAIPLVDTNKVKFIKLPNTFISNKNATERALKSLKQAGLPDEDVPTLKKVCADKITIEKASAQAQKMPYVLPECFYFSLIPPEADNGVYVTELDNKKNKFIYSISTFIPLHLDFDFQKHHFESVLCRIFAHATDVITLNTRSINYDYYISNECKLNLFITVD